MTDNEEQPVTIMVQMPTKTEVFTISGTMNFGAVARALFNVSEADIERALAIQKTNGKLGLVQNLIIFCVKKELKELLVAN